MKLNGPRALAVPVLWLLAGCAGAGGPAGGTGSGNQDLITLAEISESQAHTAFDLIQELRPRWLVRNRGERTFDTGPSDFPKVVVDEFPPREFDALREIPREVVLEIRFLSPREATFLYGTGYNEGVIKVTTRR